MAKAHKQK